MREGSTSRRGFFRTLATTPVLAVPVLACADSPDALLLELGAKFEAAWRSEKAVYAALEKAGDYSHQGDAIGNRAMVATQKIVRKIEKQRASTIEGMRIKARAIQWCHSDEIPDISEADSCTDIRLAQSIIWDLLGIGHPSRGGARNA